MTNKVFSAFLLAAMFSFLFVIHVARDQFGWACFHLLLCAYWGRQAILRSAE